MINTKWLNYIGTFFLVGLIFVCGFYFGYKNAKAGETAKTPAAVNNSVVASTTPQIEYNAKDVEGVFWLKTGQEPVCPTTHSVKGTFSDNFGYFYTKDNPRYDRIKPDICFATEAFAQNSAGFIKKF